MAEQVDIAIAGAGAAGLAAAIFAAESAREAGVARSIVLLDGAKTIGAKILVSGGGRCNVTNVRITPDDFNGNRNIVRNVLAAFDEQATVRWFESMGVRLKAEPTGKLFPVTDSARTVLDALLNRCRELGVGILPGHRIESIEPGGDGFVLHHSQGTTRSRRLIVCTGGRSLPRSGSDGHGWSMLQKLGHSVTETWPALVPLVLHDRFFHAGLSGLAQDVELTTLADGKVIDRRRGSLLWTHFGISGPVVMDASRHWIGARLRGQSATMRCAFVDSSRSADLEKRLLALAGREPKRPLLRGLRALEPSLPERFVGALLRQLAIDGAAPLAQLSRDDRRRLMAALTGLELPVLRDRGWNFAEVTAGGVPLAEIDYRSMHSRAAPGLYLAGEVLDCDGRIGGFNFQWAWATGHLAGRAAIRSLA